MANMLEKLQFLIELQNPTYWFTWQKNVSLFAM